MNINIPPQLRGNGAKTAYAIVGILFLFYLVFVTGTHTGRKKMIKESGGPENYFYTVVGLLPEQRFVVCTALGVVDSTGGIVPAPAEKVLLSYEVLQTIPTFNDSFQLKREGTKFRVLMRSAPTATRAPVAPPSKPKATPPPRRQ